MLLGGSRHARSKAPADRPAHNQPLLWKSSRRVVSLFLFHVPSARRVARHRSSSVIRLCPFRSPYFSPGSVSASSACSVASASCCRCARSTDFKSAYSRTCSAWAWASTMLPSVASGLFPTQRPSLRGSSPVTGPRQSFRTWHCRCFAFRLAAADGSRITRRRRGPARAALPTTERPVMPPPQPPSSAASVPPRHLSRGYVVALVVTLFGWQAVGGVATAFAWRVLHPRPAGSVVPIPLWVWLTLAAVAGLSSAATIRVAKATRLSLAVVLILASLCGGGLAQILRSVAR